MEPLIFLGVFAVGAAAVHAARTWLPRTPLPELIDPRRRSGVAAERLARFGEMEGPSPEPTPWRPRPDLPEELPAKLTPPPATTPPTRTGDVLASSRGPIALVASEAARRPAEAEEDVDLWIRISDFEAWPGRRERRTALIDSVADEGNWTDEEIYEAGTALWLWDDAGPYAANRNRNRKRVRRIRDAGEPSADEKPTNVTSLDEARLQRLLFDESTESTEGGSRGVA